ncbi:MAG: hypothetical protein AB1656_01320 [Candidatus Omnitrophota bacterium]
MIVNRRIFLPFFLFFAINSGYAQEVSDAKPARIPPRTVLERAQKAFEKIADLQTDFHQVTRHANGHIEELWARLIVVKSGEKVRPANSSLVLELYDRPIPSVMTEREIVQDPTDQKPMKIYFADSGRKLLYTYDPEGNALTIEKLDESGPLPEFMQLAGFLELNLDELEKKVYLDADVYQETVDGVSCYRVKIQPLKDMRGIEPDRMIWVDRKTNLPKKLAVIGETRTEIFFGECLLDRGLNAEAIVPEIPQNAQRTDLTAGQQTAKKE